MLKLQSIHAKRHNVTVDSITKELEENREIGRSEGQSAAMTAATMGKAKIHGLVTDKKEHSGSFTVSVPNKDAGTL